MMTHGERKAGVMIPIPQYPLYTATTAEYDAQPVRCLSLLLYLLLMFKGLLVSSHGVNQPIV